MTTSVLLLVVIGLLVAYAYTHDPNFDRAKARAVLTAGVAMVLALGFLQHYAAILPPFVIPLILAYLLDPVLDRLEKRGYTRVRAIVVVYGFLLLVLMLGGLLVAGPLNRQVQELLAPLTRQGGFDVTAVQQLLADQEKLQKGLAKTLLDRGVPEAWVDQLAANFDQLQLDQRLTQVARWLTEQLQRSLTWLAAQFSGLLWVLLLPITLYYFLRDFDPLRRRLYHLVPPGKRDEVSAIATAVNRALGGYLRGYALLSLAVGLCVTTVLLILTPIFEFRYGLFIGLLAGATYIVPYLGSFTSVILATLMVYFTGGRSLTEALIAFAILQSMNSVFDNVISPRVIGDQVGLHPLLVMFGLLAAGKDFGLVGVVLATPVIVGLKILLEHFIPRLGEPLPNSDAPAYNEPTPDPEPAAEPAGQNEDDDDR